MLSHAMRASRASPFVRFSQASLSTNKRFAGAGLDDSLRCASNTHAKNTHAYVACLACSSSVFRPSRSLLRWVLPLPLPRLAPHRPLTHAAADRKPKRSAMRPSGPAHGGAKSKRATKARVPVGPLPATGDGRARKSARAAVVDERGRATRRRPRSWRSTRTSRCSRIDDEARHHLRGPVDARPRLPLEDHRLRRWPGRRARRAARQSLHSGHRRSEARARGTDRSRRPDPQERHHQHRRRAGARQALFRRIDTRSAHLRQRRKRTVQSRPRSAAVRVQVVVLHAYAERRAGVDRRAAATRANCRSTTNCASRAARAVVAAG